MKYKNQALVLKEAAKVWASKHQKASGGAMDELVDFGKALSAYEAAVCAQAWTEANAAKTMYEEGLLAVRQATSQVVERYIERVAALEQEIKALRAASLAQETVSEALASVDGRSLVSG